jgi:ornithine cyclodeaminase/alanine dehydrogenase-like protein (mu-crystallin family)
MAGRIEIVPDLKQAVKGATVVLLCTSSGKPVLDLDLLSGPALVTSISTNAPMAHEIDPAALKKHGCLLRLSGNDAGCGRGNADGQEGRLGPIIHQG